MNKRMTILFLLFMSLSINSSILAQVALDFPANNAVWTRNGNMIITSHGSKLAFWDAEGNLLETQAIFDTASGDRLSINSLAISPDDRYLAIGGTPFDPIGLVFVMDLETKQFVAELENENYIQDMDWSHDGNFIAVSSPNMSGLAGEDAVIFWNTSDFSEIYRIDGDTIEGIVNLALSPDDTQVAIVSSTQEAIQVREVISGQLIANLVGNQGYSDEIEWSANGQYIVTSSTSMEEPHFLITIWDTSSWTDYLTIQAQSSFDDIKWNPIYPIFGVQDSDEIIVFDYLGNLLSLFVGGNSFTWSPDGTKIAVGDPMDYTRLRIYDVCTNEELSDEIMPCPEPIEKVQ